MLKHLPDTFVGLGRALEVLLSTNLLADVFGLGVSMLVVRQSFSSEKAESHLLGSDWLLRSLVQLLNRLLVVSQILLAAHQDDRETLAEMEDLGDPLRARSMSVLCSSA